MAYREVTIGGVKGIAVLLREGFLKVVLEDGHTLILATADPSAKLGKVFNEDQPRDDDGRFASGGGGAHESDQDRSHREFRENYNRVQQDLESATDGQIERAINYAQHVASNANPKAWEGDAQALLTVNAMRSEADSLKFALRMRREEGDAKLHAMSPAKINAEFDALDAEDTKVNDALLAAGRGREGYQTIIRGTDSLSIRAAKAFARRSALREEVARRYGPGAPRRLPTRKMDGSGGGWSAPTSATSGIAGYELGGERRRRKPKKQRNSLNLDPHSGAKAM